MNDRSTGCADAGAFSEWHPLEAGATLAAMPPLPGVIQVRRARGLERHPRGKSAMVLYAPAGDVRAWLEAHREKVAEEAAAAGVPGALWIRSRTVAEPEAVCGELLDRFVARFGAPPTLQLRDWAVEGRA